MKILCFGFGFVGKAYALFLREQGHEVSVITGFDKTRDEALSYNFNEPKAKDFDAIFISVPTPTSGRIQDVSILEGIAKKITQDYNSKYVLLKSTVLPENIKKIKSILKKDQQLIMYPEFLEARNPIGGVFNQSFVVFGKEGSWTLEEKKFFSELLRFPVNNITFTNFETASMIKYAHNIWLACNISFWNSIMRTSVKNVDFETVLNEVHKSPYFGKHPWSIGTAYGGACLPKDIKAYLGSIEKDTVFKKFIESIDEVNEEVEKSK